MKFEISVKIYREEKYIRKRKFSSLKKIIRLLYDSSSPNHDFQFISFNLQFYPITLIIFRALEIPSSSRRGEKVGANTILAFLPSLFFFFFLFFSPLYPITRFGTSLSFRFNRVAHRKKSNYLPFLLAFRQHRFPLFRDKEILSPIVPFIFTEDNLPFLIPLFIIASRFESFAQRKSRDQFIKLST